MGRYEAGQKPLEASREKLEGRSETSELQLLTASF
jgi:hypothetical protein